jgi:LuxR family quorum-sensing system transcriptional regulator SolR
MASRSDTHWWVDAFTAINDARSPEVVFRQAGNFIRSIGFEWFSYGIQIPTGVRSASIEVFNSFPTSWLSHYIDRSYISHDPTIRLCVQGDTPIIWSDAVFAGEEASRIWSDARDFNLRFGISLPSWSRSVFGVLSAARSSETMPAAELAEVVPKLTWLADNLHRCMHALIGPRVISEEVVGRLSEREIEILGWTADGKTSWEIGRILGITERTVNFHVNNIVIKLKAQNKVQAAAKALSLGIISPHQSGLVLRCPLNPPHKYRRAAR